MWKILEEVAICRTQMFHLCLKTILVPISKRYVVVLINTLRTGSFKLFKRPFPRFLTILTL